MLRSIVLALWSASLGGVSAFFAWLGFSDLRALGAERSDAVSMVMLVAVGVPALVALFCFGSLLAPKLLWVVAALIIASAVLLVLSVDMIGVAGFELMVILTGVSAVSAALAFWNDRAEAAVRVRSPVQEF